MIHLSCAWSRFHVDQPQIVEMASHFEEMFYRDDTFPVFTGFPVFFFHRKRSFLRSMQIRWDLRTWFVGGGVTLPENTWEVYVIPFSYNEKKNSLAPSALATLMNYFDMWVTGCVQSPGKPWKSSGNLSGPPKSPGKSWKWMALINNCKIWYFKEKNMCPR